MKASELFVNALKTKASSTSSAFPAKRTSTSWTRCSTSPIRFVTTRHEQGAAFMADVYGRLTGSAGVCLSTLGPGATNLITGVADANMDRAPVVAIAGQGATTRLHKESHQILDLVNMFEPITKYATQIREPEIVPEIVRKAFKVAQTEKPGACLHRLPREHRRDEGRTRRRSRCRRPTPRRRPISRSTRPPRSSRTPKRPMILAGNGVIRQGAADSLVRFAEVLRIPVANTFMAKGVMPFANELSLGTIGLKARDLPWFAFEKADVVICVGYDMVEYHPDMWNPDSDKTIIHIDALPAEVDAHYIVAVGVLGDIGDALARASRCKAQAADRHAVQAAAQGDRRRTARSYAEDQRLPGQAAEDRLGPARGAGARRHRDLRRGRAQDVDGAHVPRRAARTPASSPTASPRWGSRCRAPSPRSSLIPSAKSSRSPATPAS